MTRHIALTLTSLPSQPRSLTIICLSTKHVHIINLCLLRSLFCAIIQIPMGKPHCIFSEGTWSMLTSSVASKDTSSLHHSLPTSRGGTLMRCSWNEHSVWHPTQRVAVIPMDCQITGLTHHLFAHSLILWLRHRCQDDDGCTLTSVVSLGAFQACKTSWKQKNLAMFQHQNLRAVLGEISV